MVISKGDVPSSKGVAGVPFVLQRPSTLDRPAWNEYRGR